jgi:hypothetical protein
VLKQARRAPAFNAKMFRARSFGFLLGPPFFRGRGRLLLIC